MKKGVVYRQGFTVVELIVVIIVVAILATVIIVAYNGVQDRTNDATVQADLRNTYNKILEYETEYGLHPSNSSVVLQPILAATKKAYPDDSRYSYLYCRNNENYAVAGLSKSGRGFYVGNNGTGEILNWPSANATICPQTGVATASAGGYSYYWWETNSGWTW